MTDQQFSLFVNTDTDDEAGFSDLESGFERPAIIAGPVLDEHGQSWYDRHRIDTAPVDPAPAAVDTGRAHGPALDELLDLNKADTLLCWEIEKSSYREETCRIMFRRGRMSMEASCAKRASEDRKMAACCAKLIPSIGIDFAHALKKQYKHDGVLRAQRQFGSSESAEPTPAAIIDAAAQSAGRALTTREACALFAPIDTVHCPDCRAVTEPDDNFCPACGNGLDAIRESLA